MRRAKVEVKDFTDPKNLRRFELAVFRYTPDQRVFVNGVNITKRLDEPETDAIVFHLAKIPRVREIICEVQHEFIDQESCLILEGRDIGSVVCPEARVKIYLTASPEARAQRRYDQRQRKGFASASVEELVQEIEKRDRMDMEREHSPLIVPNDAVVIDSSDLSREETIEEICRIVIGVFPGLRPSVGRQKYA